MGTLFTEYLQNRLVQINQVMERKQRALRYAPEGRLRVSRSGKGVRYYQVTDPANPGGRYLGKEEYGKAKCLAQKKYDQDVLRALEREKGAIETVLASYGGMAAEDIFGHLLPERQKMVEPFFLPEDLLIQRWEQEEYTKKPVEEDIPELYTDREERVRSKSEVMIANKLRQMGIPYRYECGLALKNGVVLYPDFTILHVKKRKTVYLEHFGMMDDAGYSEDKVQRINMLAKNNILPGRDLFFTMETKAYPLNIRQTEELFRAWFQ